MKKAKSLVEERCPLCKGSPRRHIPGRVKILCPKCGGSGRKISCLDIKFEESKKS